MPPAGYFIDASLLVLLVVGDEGREFISKHKRLQHFTTDDYETLRTMVRQADRVFVTPNTLTETSNLLAQHADPERSLFFDRLRLLIGESEEITISSAEASSNSSYRRLGLTDAALLEVVTADTPLVTVDFDLYIAAARKDPDAALNFIHYRSL